MEGEVNSRVASGFAGGIGNTGSVCGAVVGAVMAIGLGRERAESMEGMLENLGVAEELRRRFEAEMGHLNCRDLTQADLTSPEGIEAFVASDTPQRVCYPAVATAYKLALELIGTPA